MILSCFLTEARRLKLTLPVEAVRRSVGMKMWRSFSFRFEPVLLLVLMFWGSGGVQETREEEPPDGGPGAFFALRSCHRLLRGDAGDFFSPDYLCSNPPLWCNWTIQVDPGKRVHLQLEDLTPPHDCHLKQDQVHLDDPAGHFRARRILQKCWREAAYTSSADTLHVVLLIGGRPSPPYRGFHGRYQAFGPPVVYDSQEWDSERNKDLDLSPGLVEEPSDPTLDFYQEPSPPPERPQGPVEVGVDHALTAGPTVPAGGGAGGTPSEPPVSDVAPLRHAPRARTRPPTAKRRNVEEDPTQMGEGLHQEGADPQQKGAGLHQEEAGLHHQEAGPQQEEAGPKQEEAGPQQEEAGPQQEEAGPQQEEAGPQQEEAGPQQEEAGPQQEEAGPQQEEAGPQQEEAGLHQEEAGPRRMEAERLTNAEDRMEVASDHRGNRCCDGMSGGAKGVYVMFFLLSALILTLLGGAGVLYQRHHRGAFLVRCHGDGSIAPPSRNENYSNPADLPPPPPPAWGLGGGWSQVKERPPVVDVPLLRFSPLLKTCT